MSVSSDRDLGRKPVPPRAGDPPHRLLTSVQALECLVGEEAQPCVRNDPQHGGRESVVEGLQALFPGDADEDVKDVAVPAGPGDGAGEPWARRGGSAPPAVRQARGWCDACFL